MEQTNTRKRAKDKWKSGEVALDRWWSKKYSLPPNHELFLNRTRSSLEEEWLMDLMDRREELELELKAKPKNAAAIKKQIVEIDKALGSTTEVEDKDDLLDRWEEQIARGERPDFSSRN